MMSLCVIEMLIPVNLPELSIPRDFRKFQGTFVIAVERNMARTITKRVDPSTSKWNIDAFGCL